MFHLLDQLNGVDQKTFRVMYEDSVRDSVCSRVTEGETAELGQGEQHFITHTTLKPKYKRNDTLLFQIQEVEFWA